MRGLRLALGFLTTVPWGASGHLQSGDLGRSAMWYPVVGLAVGLVLIGAWELMRPGLSPPLTAVLSVTLWALLTGALHLDGLADCCDGLFTSAGPERRLEIMADSRSGAFAVVGLVMFLLLKVASVASLESSAGLLLAPVLGRWWMLPMAATRPAKPKGLGSGLHEELTWSRFLFPAVTVATVAFFIGVNAGLALVTTGVATLIVGLFAARRIGGQTGDVLGANCELVEWITLMVFIVV